MPQAKILRKVRARKGSMPDNVRGRGGLVVPQSRAMNPLLYRECHRKHTAAPSGKGEKVR